MHFSKFVSHLRAQSHLSYHTYITLLYGGNIFRSNFWCCQRHINARSLRTTLNDGSCLNSTKTRASEVLRFNKFNLCRRCQRVSEKSWGSVVTLATHPFGFSTQSLIMKLLWAASHFLSVLGDVISHGAPSPSLTFIVTKL